MTALSCVDILPVPSAVRLVDSRVEREENLIVSYHEVTRLGVACPECGVISQSVHSTRHRIIHDLPIFGQRVQLRVPARCFRCVNLNCSRKWFTEQIPGLSVRYQRRTPRAQDQVVTLGIKCGGEALERLGWMMMMGLNWSADTFLRAVLCAPDLDHSYDEVHVLGVDDWAMRKGQRYGTLCYDVEHHRPLDILPNRESETLSDWMKEMPCQPTTVTRDGSQTYHDAIDTGSPHAVQIADRFHIKKNFNEAVDHLVKLLLHSYPPALDDPEKPSVIYAESQSERNIDARRRARWEKIHEFSKNERTNRSIALQLGISRSSVHKFLQMDHPPVPQRWNHRKVDAYITYLQCRWESGVHNVKQLYGEIRELGFDGKYSQLAAHLSSWKESPLNTRTTPGTSPKEWYRRWIQKPSDQEPEIQMELYWPLTTVATAVGTR